MPAISILKPTSQSISWNRQGTPPTLSNITITVVENVPILYVQYYIQYENTAVPWLDTPYASSSYLPYDGGPVTLPLTLATNEISGLAAGNYKATIYIELSTADEVIRTLSTVVNFSLTGNPANQITTDKSNYTVVYRRSTNQLSGDTHVNILNNTLEETLSLETVGSNLFQELSFTTNFNLVEDANFPFATNPELPLSGSIVVPCRIKKSGINVCSFNVTIIVIDQNDIVITPNRFDFQLRRSFNETKSLNLQIANPLGHNFTLEAPYWINLSSNTGNSTTDIIVTTSNSDILENNFYSDFILLKYNGKIIEIPVTITVTNFLTVDVKDYNFCLDKVMLRINQMFENAVFARLNLKIKFETDEGVSEITSVYSIPYFSGKVETDIGQKVQNYFPVYRKHLFEESNISFNNKLIYRPATVIVTVEELDVNYNILHTSTLHDIKLFAGKRPLKFPLLSNFGLRRRYASFSHIFSFYTELVDPSHLIKNGSSNPVTSHDVQSALVTDDLILDFNFINNNIGLDFIPFPKVEREVVLQWLNNNLVPECMIFSGSYVIQDDFEHSVDSYQINGKKYNTNEVGKITIKSGFILNEEILLLKEISKSLISFIKIGGNIYECLCTTSKLIREDSEENLVQREMEFFIVL